MNDGTRRRFTDDLIRSVTQEDKMTDYVRGADLSRFQQRPDFGKLAADGISFVVLKATENLAVDPDFAWNRDAAAKLDMPALAYAFLRPTDTDATIDHFLDVTAGLVPALDWEASGVAAATVVRWINRCEARLNRKGLVYYGLYPPTPATTTIAEWPRWFPQYPGNDTAAAKLPAWDGAPNPDWRKCWLIWQWSGGGQLSGIPGQFDLNRLSPGCSLDSFRAWIATGQFTTPSVVPRSSAPPTITAPAFPVPITIPDAKAMQSALNAAGCDVGSVDGIWGKRSSAALTAFYASR